MSEGNHSARQTIYICAAIVIAIVLAVFAPHFAMKFHLGGEVFLNLLKMMVVPLVMLLLVLPLAVVVPSAGPRAENVRAPTTLSGSSVDGRASGGQPPKVIRRRSCAFASGR